MTNHTVILINGRPRTGKDTVVNFMCNALMERGYMAEAFSSIDPVKAMLGAVVDLSQKTEADRILLSEVGDALEKHSAFRTNRCIWFAEDVFRASENAVVFLHVREPENIEKLRATFLAKGVNVVRLLVVSDRGIDVDSRADQVAGTGEYDLAIRNNSTLGVLKACCWNALSEMRLYALGGTVKGNPLQESLAPDQ